MNEVSIRMTNALHRLHLDRYGGNTNTIASGMETSYPVPCVIYSVKNYVDLMVASSSLKIATTPD
jgi:hypothetical protein